MGRTDNYRIWVCGDSNLLVDYGQIRSVPAGIKAVMVKKILTDKGIPGIIDMIPCNTSLLIQFDPRVLQVEVLYKKVQKIVDKVERNRKIRIPSRIIEIPVYFPGQRQQSKNIAETSRKSRMMWTLSSNRMV